jgi:hypothetical protein
MYHFLFQFVKIGHGQCQSQNDPRHVVIHIIWIERSSCNKFLDKLHCNGKDHPDKHIKNLYYVFFTDNLSFSVHIEQPKNEVYNQVLNIINSEIQSP